MLAQMAVVCPKCQDRNLVQVAVHLFADQRQAPWRCPGCHGIWLLESSIEHLRESGVVEQLDSGDTTRRDQDHKTGICPEGHGIMTRARVAWEDPYYLERCIRCGGIWFDAGEWNRLASDNLLEQLDRLWTPGWRRRLSHDQSEAQRRADLRTAFGSDLLEQLDAVAEALAGRHDAAIALAYLRARVLEG